MRRSSLILFTLLLLAVPSRLDAQKNRFDAALDLYEAICKESIRIQQIRTREERIAELSAKLEELRKELAGIEGQMDRRQKRRYEAIRKKYNLFHLYGIDLPINDGPDPYAVAPLPLPIPDAEQPFAPTEKHPVRPSYFADVALGVRPLTASLSGGAVWNRWGAWIRLGTGFSFPRTDYTWTRAPKEFWASGESAEKCLYASAGALFRPSRLPRLGVRAGAGFFLRDVHWKDIGGKWSRIQKKSIRTACLDASLQWQLGRAYLSAGTLVLRTPVSFVPYAGIGLFF